MTDEGADTLDVWTSEMQRIGMVGHDLIARFDQRFIEKVLEEPADGLEHDQKGKHTWESNSPRFAELSLPTHF